MLLHLYDDLYGVCSHCNKVLCNNIAQRKERLEKFVPPLQTRFSCLFFENCLSAMVSSVEGSGLAADIKSVIPSEPNDSDVMLYTPDIDLITREKGCECFFMQCCLLELRVYHAEQGEDGKDLKNTEKLLKMIKDGIGRSCSQCETQPIANITTFSSTLRQIIQRWESLPTNQFVSCFKPRN